MSNCNNDFMRMEYIYQCPEYKARFVNLCLWYRSRKDTKATEYNNLTDIPLFFKIIQSHSDVPDIYNFICDDAIKMSPKIIRLYLILKCHMSFQ